MQSISVDLVMTQSLTEIRNINKSHNSPEFWHHWLILFVIPLARPPKYNNNTADNKNI